MTMHVRMLRKRRVENPLPNPAYLNAVLHAIDAECRLLGLYGPSTQPRGLPDPPELPDISGMSYEEMVAVYRKLRVNADG